MAKVLETLVNFESGTFHELESITGAPAIVTDPAPGYEYETYMAKLDTVAECKLHMPNFAPGGNKYVIGSRIRFDLTGNPAPFAFFMWYGPEGAGTTDHDFYLTLKASDGRIRLYDANSALVATSAADAIETDTEYLMELLFTHGDPGDLIVHLAKGPLWESVEIFNVSGEDFDGSS